MSLPVSTKRVFPLVRLVGKRHSSTTATGTTHTNTSASVQSTGSVKTSENKPLKESIPKHIKAHQNEESLLPDTEFYALLRLRRFNEKVMQKLRSLQKDTQGSVNVSLEELSKQKLSPREKQLDEELDKFFEKHLHEKDLIKINNNRDEKTQQAATYFPTNVSSKQVLSKDFPNLNITDFGRPYTAQELFLRQLKHSATVGKLGAKIDNVYFPNNDIYNPLQANEVTIEHLMAAGVHLGQATSLWNTSTHPFVYGSYKGIHIIDLNKTLQSLKRSCKVVEGIAERGGIILFLGSEAQRRVISNAAKMCRGYGIHTRWIGGTLTNPTEIAGGWARQKVDMADNPTGEPLTDLQTDGLIKPDLIIVLNPKQNKTALKEAMKVRIPTIGIVDTDCEPSLVTYPIPGNDDSARSVNLIAGILARAGETGLNKRLRKE
ncbi:hypothetical protein ACO0RG_001905 [Hanseniaspora osmophila]|uniref:37S ribosomal protein MRP4, mitochondrial n=1 Tax=Hanseniaspora osmophila TaxID=56408 RepID=A0A1E5RHQ5_9ASCO|nr:37S ribosomal protein MRP4, mitochondrial [Hanseniaspora osmophila]